MGGDIIVAPQVSIILLSIIIMISHRIVCTEQIPCNLPNSVAHIVAVGIGILDSKATKRMTLKEVLVAMDRGELFFTKGSTSGMIAFIKKFVCPHCVKTHIKSRADAVYDNNLDYLRRCQWSK